MEEKLRLPPPYPVMRDIRRELVRFSRTSARRAGEKAETEQSRYESAVVDGYRGSAGASYAKKVALELLSRL